MSDWRDRVKELEVRLDNMQAQIDFLKSQVGVTFHDQENKAPVEIEQEAEILTGDSIKE